MSKDSNKKIKKTELLAMDKDSTKLNLWYEFQNTALNFPHKVAIIDGEKSISYAQLHQKSLLLAHKILKLSDSDPFSKSILNNSRFLAVLLPQGIDFITATFSTHFLGKILVPLSSTLTPDKINFMLKETGSPFLLTTSEMCKQLGISYENLYLIENCDEKITENEEVKICSPFAYEEIANCYYTSGSTGTPKGVLLSHYTCVADNRFHKEYMKLKSSDKILLFLNNSFVFSHRELMTGIFAGATLVVAPPELRFDIQKLRAWVKEKEISHLFMVCSTASIFMDAPPHEFSTYFSCITFAGEKFKGKLRDDNPFKRLHTYGNTESLGISYFEVPQKFELEILPVGVVHPDVKVKILDESLNEVKNGESGEICIGGNFISNGYYKRDELNEQKFIILEGERFYRSGDQGYFLPDGNLVLNDRIDNMVKINGNRFELGEIESIIMKYEGVFQAIAAFQKSNSRIHVFYGVKDGYKIPSNKIREFLEPKVPHFVMPASITCVSKFPVNSNGKIDRIALLGQINEEKVIVLPTNKIEKLLLQIWSKVLKIKESEISTDSNFFGVGGNSLQIAQILNELKDDKMTVKTFFSNPTIQKQALFLESSNNNVEEHDKIDIFSELKIFTAKLNELEFTTNNNEDFLSSGNILLTGSTGYLGGYLLMKLLENEPNSKIWCIIRSKDVENAKDRLFASFLLFNHFDSVEGARKWLTKFEQRVEIISGDVSKTQLGLKSENYLNLASKINRVYHVASEVNFFKSYEDLKSSNTIGVLNIIKFCSETQIKMLCHISTVAVEEVEENLCKNEKNMEIDHLNGYRLSKWLGEAIVQNAMNKGLPGIVFRPGVIGNVSFNKAILNPKDFIEILIKNCKECGFYPDIDFKFPYGSLDYTTQYILSVTENEILSKTKSNKDVSDKNATFNAWESEKSFKEFIKEESGNDLKEIPLADWKIKVASNSEKEEARLLMELVDLQLKYKKINFESQIEIKKIATRILPLVK